MNQSYELLYLVPSQITEEELSGITEKVRKIIEQGGGKTTKNELWSKRKLAYPIKQARQAYYWLVEYSSENTDNAQIIKELRLIPSIIRFLITEMVKVPAKKPRMPKPRTVLKSEKLMDQSMDKEKKPAPKDDKVSLEDLDRKLDELLDDNIEEN